MSLYAKIRRLYFREKTPISEIARRTSLSRNTVKKWLRAAERSELKYTRKPGPTKLDPHIEQLQQAMAADAHRPKRDRRTLKTLFRQLQAQGYRGSYSRLTQNVRRWQAQHGAVTARAA
ncbi:MAG TPA: IS21 family transposase, partial [Acetobacteraceae bacterium]|nr:IS21 family transposase [Acetobacteraceae bacterium]